MKFEIDLDNLKEIYLTSNTASFLFDKFSKDENLQLLSKKYSDEELINAFLNLAKAEITLLEDLVFAYSLYIAIILKDTPLVYDFFKNNGNIDFEWFNDLRSIYFERLKSTHIFSFKNHLHSLKPSKIDFKSSEYVNIQTIE